MAQTATQVEEVRLILTAIETNNNKWWKAIRYDDNSVHISWGRVGENGQSQTKGFSSPDQAEGFVAKKRKEKERKGYTLQRTMGSGPSKSTPVTDKTSLAKLATDQIEADDTTRLLIAYLAQVNIHNIEATTQITYDTSAGTFSTPLGVVTLDGIVEAEGILAKIGDFVLKNKWEDKAFSSFINDYMRIVPQDIGRGKPDPKKLYPDVSAIQAQQQILDSLRASLQNIEAAAQSTQPDAPVLFRVKLTTVAHDHAEGTETFKRIQKKFRDGINVNHRSSSWALRRVYVIEIAGMSETFEADGAKLDNIWELWHGTRAANLLSMMRSGYVIPRSGGSIAITGRMYGDGVYFSDQSTKSLNYAIGHAPGQYWGGGFQDDKSYMLLNEVAMGKYYVPSRSFTGGCRPGFDSTYAKAGQSGIMNNEMIVYRTSQVRPKYLCEFGRA